VDLNSRSSALQNAVWSTSVQHGQSGGQQIIDKALSGKLKDGSAAGMSDRDMINAIYDERGRKDEKGGLVHFPNSDAKNQEGVAKRYEKERQDALDSLPADQKK
jgi:hypothetical protein